MAKIIFDGKTKAEWEDLNPILAKGELVYETDTRKVQVGDGVRNYVDLLPTCGYRSYVAIIELGNSTPGQEPQVIQELSNDLGVDVVGTTDNNGVSCTYIGSPDKFINNKTVVLITPMSATGGSASEANPNLLSANMLIIENFIFDTTGDIAFKEATSVSGVLVHVEIRVYE